MKHLLRQAETTMRSGVLRVKTWFDPPLPADARALEIREAVIADVERHSEPAGDGRRVLPQNHVVVTVLAPEKEDRERLQAALASLQEAIGVRLSEIRCQVPARFGVDVRFAKRPGPAWREGQRLDVAYDMRPGTASETNGDPPALHVTIIRGTATQPSYLLTESQIRIGRTASPVGSRGHARRNHVVFVEGGDEHSQTVGRAHASIHYDRARGEYRLFDDGSHNGTRVVRRNGGVEVVPRDPVGVAIVSGDEIEFGTAAIKVEIGT